MSFHLRVISLLAGGILAAATAAGAVIAPSGQPAAPHLLAAKHYFAAGHLLAAQGRSGSRLEATSPILLAQAGTPPASAPTTAGASAASPATASATAPASWPMVGANPLHSNSVSGDINPAQLALSWQNDVRLTEQVATTAAGNPEEVLITHPIIAGPDTVFITIRDTLTAVSVITGETLWHFKAPLKPGETAEPTLAGPPAYDNGFVFVATQNNRLYRIDASTGKPVGNETTLSDQVSAYPTVADGVLYEGTQDGRLTAYTITDRAQPPAAAWSVVVSPRDALRGVISVLADRIYVGTNGGNVVALNRSTGKVQAAYDTSAPVLFGVYADGDNIYVPSGPRLLNLYPTGLQVHWTQQFQGQVVGLPAVSKGILYVGTSEGGLYAFDPQRRAVNWAVSLGSDSTPKSGPVIVGDTLFVATTNGHVFGFATGGDGAGHARLLWRYLTVPLPSFETLYPGFQPDASLQPIVVGTNLLVMEDNGTLNCLTPAADDNDAPTIDYRYPVGGPFPTKPIPTIGARIRDAGSGVLTSTIRLFVDNAEVTTYKFDADTADLSYTPAQPLADGQHTVRVIASDYRHNTRDVQWTFKIDHNVQATTTPNGFGG